MNKDIKGISYIVKKKKSGPGSWKWMIILAYGSANLLIIPCLTSFGLIFKDKFRELNFSAMEATLILNLNSALGMTFGLFNGVLLNTFGFRKVAVLGGLLFSSGITSTAFASTFQHFLITYSIIASIGMGLCSSSFQLALNTYFKENRNKAFGIGATITGLGPILFPHLISFLLSIYGAKGCILIIGGLTMNIVCSALLLKPLKNGEKIQNFDDNKQQVATLENGSLYKPTPSISRNSTANGSLHTISDNEGEYLETCPIFHDVDTQSIYGFDVVLHPLANSEEFLWKDLDYKFQPRPIPRSQSEHQIRKRPLSANLADEDDEVFEMQQPSKRWFESGSVASVNLGSSMKIFHEDEKMAAFRRSQSRLRIFDDKSFLGRRASLLKMNFMQRRATVAAIPENDLPKIEEEKPLTPKDAQQALQVAPSTAQQQQSKKKKISICDHIRNGWKRFVKVFDLGLLNDKIYLNIMLGISIAIFAEINFSLLTPFILNEYQYSTEEIATFMSLLATVDIFIRFISPFIGDYFKQPARIMYMYALFMLIVMRTSLICTNSYQGILIVAIGMGLAKGVRQVYMSCIIPSYIPLDRLAAASGIQMVANGVVLLSMGSSVGAIRDFFGSYTICVIFINIVTFITLSMWTAELIYMKRKNARAAKEAEQNQIPELCKYNIEVN